MPADQKEQPDTIAEAIGDISESLNRIVQDEIALARAEVTAKVTSIARGTAAVAAGAVFGIFAVVFFLTTLAWAFNSLLVRRVPDVWVGFLIVFGILLSLAIIAALIARRLLRVGAPIPSMAIDEAKKVQATVAAQSTPPPEVGP